MKSFWIVVVAALACCSPARSAEPGYWRDADGQALVDTDARKSKDGFAGWLLVTSDEDWKDKWERPAAVAPSFNEAKVVGRDKKLFVLTFFANPALTPAGDASVLCDLRVTRPDGSASVDRKGAICFEGHLPGDPANLYLSNSVLGFVGEAGDPAGVWKIEVVLKDNQRKTVLPLAASFELR